MAPRDDGAPTLEDARVVLEGMRRQYLRIGPAPECVEVADWLIEHLPSLIADSERLAHVFEEIAGCHVDEETGEVAYHLDWETGWCAPDYRSAIDADRTRMSTSHHGSEP